MYNKHNHSYNYIDYNITNSLKFSYHTSMYHVSASTTVSHRTSTDFYLYYYLGHKSQQFGHEYIDYEIKHDTLYYNNVTRYKNDKNITKSVPVNNIIYSVIQTIYEAYNIDNMYDTEFPPDNNYDGKQIIHIEYTDSHNIKHSKILVSSNIESYLQASQYSSTVQQYYYFLLNIKSLLQQLITAHFKEQPIDTTQ